MITELNDFYLIDNKLLYVCKDFIGFNPTISKGLAHETIEKTGITIKVDEFEMCGSAFKAILTNYFAMGPIRGYKRVEILQDGHTIIRYERGGKGHGSNYSEGNNLLVEYGKAYLITEGYAMRSFNTDNIYSDLKAGNHYFLLFDNIIIPKKYKLDFERKKMPVKKIYTKLEIEPLRQVEWKAKIKINNKIYHIIRTSIPGFFKSLRTSDGHEEYKRSNCFAELGQTDITVLNKNSTGYQNTCDFNLN